MTVCYIINMGGKSMHSIDELKEKVPGDVFTDTFLKNYLSGTEDSRYSLVKRWMKQGEIIRLKKGLYALGDNNRKKGLNLFQAAQMLYGPSYISFESALSYHGWISEAVHTVTSAVAKRCKEIKTPVGVFSYTPVKFRNFFAGVDRVENESGVFLMASPWRALADYIYAYRKTWKGLKPAVEDLRIDPENFKNTDFKELEELYNSAQNSRVKVFIEKSKKELIA